MRYIYELRKDKIVYNLEAVLEEGVSGLGRVLGGALELGRRLPRQHLHLAPQKCDFHWATTLDCVVKVNKG